LGGRGREAHQAMGIRECWRRHRGAIDRERSPILATSGDDLDADIIPEQVYHDAALAFLNAQISASDGLDGKASQALTVGSAALPLTIALVNCCAGQRGRDDCRLAGGPTTRAVCAGTRLLPGNPALEPATRTDWRVRVQTRDARPEAQLPGPTTAAPGRARAQGLSHGCVDRVD